MRILHKRLVAAAGLIVALGGTWAWSVVTRPADPDAMVVHEWGTFTSLQDETGRAVGGINVDDEPVPGFVHRLARPFVRPEDTIAVFQQGAPRYHPDVTMRLETPVVYFYPPQGASLPVTASVRVAFRGGWLTEYYPDAEVAAPGVWWNEYGRARFGRLTGQTVGELRWADVRFGTDGAGPETDSHVWTAPREVEAAMVRVGDEAERYLFYRGVGHVDAPLRVVRDEAEGVLRIEADFSGLPAEGAAPSVTVPAMWLVDVRPDGRVAFRTLDPFTVRAHERSEVAATAAAFAPDAYRAENLDRLRAEMHAALVADGLYADEARAMLRTWELSYFQSHGTRLFFLLPRAWTDHVLPLEVTGAGQVVRTMVGRVELVTPEHRRLLDRIEAAPEHDAGWLFELRAGHPNLHRKSRSERKAPLTDATAPDAYRAYQRLGRFRDALLIDAAERRDSESLRGFMEAYRVLPYEPVTE